MYLGKKIGIVLMQLMVSLAFRAHGTIASNPLLGSERFGGYPWSKLSVIVDSSNRLDQRKNWLGFGFSGDISSFNRLKWYGFGKFCHRTACSNFSLGLLQSSKKMKTQVSLHLLSCTRESLTNRCFALAIQVDFRPSKSQSGRSICSSIHDISNSSLEGDDGINWVTPPPFPMHVLGNSGEKLNSDEKRTPERSLASRSIDNSSESSSRFRCKACLASEEDIVLQTKLESPQSKHESSKAYEYFLAPISATISDHRERLMEEYRLRLLGLSRPPSMRLQSCKEPLQEVPPKLVKRQVHPSVPISAWSRETTRVTESFEMDELSDSEIDLFFQNCRARD